MKKAVLSLVLISIFINSIVSSPTSNADASCPPYTCIVDTSFCFCGVTQTPEDRCCKATCTPCPPDFNVKPWLTIDWSSFTLPPIQFPLLRRGWVKIVFLSDYFCFNQIKTNDRLRAQTDGSFSKYNWLLFSDIVSIDWDNKDEVFPIIHRICYCNCIIVTNTNSSQ